MDNLKLFEKIILNAQWFDVFKTKKDIHNMFESIYRMRYYHGKLLHELFILNIKCGKMPSSLKTWRQYYDLSILDSIINNCTQVINDCENILKNHYAKKQQDNIPKINLTSNVENITNIFESHETPEDVDTNHIHKSKYNENDSSMLFFYDPRCQHCVDAGKVWKDLVNKTNERGIKLNLISLNCKEKTDFCKKFGIAFVPTIKIFHNGNVYQLDKKITTDSITQFAKDIADVNL
jgi:hypothetical protein